MSAKFVKIIYKAIIFFMVIIPLNAIAGFMKPIEEDLKNLARMPLSLPKWCGIRNSTQIFGQQINGM
jgi:hypothetical protein